MPIIRFEITDATTAAGINGATISIRPAVFAPQVTATVGGVNGVFISPILGPRIFRIKVEAGGYSAVEENINLSDPRYTDPPPPAGPIQLRFPIDLEPITPERQAQETITEGFKELGNDLNELEMSIEQSNVGESRNKIRSSNELIENLRELLAGYVNNPEYDNLKTNFNNFVERSKQLQKKAESLRPQGFSWEPTKKKFGVPSTGFKGFNRSAAIFAGIITVLFLILYFIYVNPFLVDNMGGGNAAIAGLLLIPTVALGSYFGFHPLSRAFSEHLPNVIVGGTITLFAYILIGLPLVNSIPGIRDVAILKFGIIPGIIFAIATISSGGKGFGRTVAHAVVWSIIGFVLLLLIKFITTGTAFEFDTYVNALDGLRFVGVPRDAIENMKDGIRNALSFLQFKEVEEGKPEAKKVGGFEAIELKFGSSVNSYVLPTLFARMDYTLPVTVTNPNKFGTNLVVENFSITEIFINNRSDDKILCGGRTVGDGMVGKIELGDVSTEEEKLATVEFKGKTRGVLNEKDEATGMKVNCIEVLKGAGKTVTNPLFPATFRLDWKKPSEETKSKTDDCRNICRDEGNVVLSGHKTRYGLDGDGEIDENESRYISGDAQCECKTKRFYNILDNLCFMSNDKATVKLTSSYGFKVQGKGELILVKTDADRKLAPRPTITSSAGPLTVTAYFISDTHVFEPGSSSKATKMFVQIKNDGDGIAKINSTKINDGTSDINITNCSPDPTRLTIGDEPISAVCDVEMFADSSTVSGSYKTLPVIVDIDYTYSQEHSTTVNVKKAAIPDGVTEQDQIDELESQFVGLPYYCEPGLQIY